MSKPSWARPVPAQFTTPNCNLIRDTGVPIGQSLKVAHRCRQAIRERVFKNNSGYCNVDVRITKCGA
jgi:hypothetical protein